MKNFLKEACCFCDNLKISKHYDCATEIRCGKKDSPCFAVNFKSDFSVTPMQIMIAGGAAVLVMLTASAICAMRKKK